MNRQKFLAELSRLLGFMSSWDREAEMNKYTAMFDAAEDEAALIESIGTPTQIAISVALGYKPSPRPGTQPPETEPASDPEPAEQPENGASPDGTAESSPNPESEPVPEPEPPPPPKRKRGEDEIVTDVEFDYGMELALLMGEPVAAAVESAFKGEYLPDPDLSLDEILREVRGGAPCTVPSRPEDVPPAKNWTKWRTMLPLPPAMLQNGPHGSESRADRAVPHHLSSWKPSCIKQP